MVRWLLHGNPPTAGRERFAAAAAAAGRPLIDEGQLRWVTEVLSHFDLVGRTEQLAGFIAAARAEDGRVVGVDISASEVQHANARAAARGVAERLSFVMADIERLPAMPQLEVGSFDVVISNGVTVVGLDPFAAEQQSSGPMQPQSLGF